MNISKYNSISRTLETTNDILVLAKLAVEINQDDFCDKYGFSQYEQKNWLDLITVILEEDLV